MDFNFFFRRFFDDDNFSRHSVETNTQELGNDDAYFDDSLVNLNSFNGMFKQMEDVFNKIFISSSGLEFSKSEEMGHIEENPRNIMLKDSSDETISHFKESNDAYPLLKVYDSEMEPNQKFYNFSYSKFSSMKTVYLPDGTIEEHQTVIDSDGTKTTKVRRAIGDASHEVITKSDEQGVKEREENLINLDGNELPDFEKSWSNLKRNVDLHIDDSLNPPASRPSYFHFLKKFFGSSQEKNLN